MRLTSSGVVLRNILHLGVAQVATTALGILGTAALGRSLGPSDFGILYIVFSISGFMGIIMDWGQSTYVVRELARGRSDQPELIGSAVLIRAINIVFAAVTAVIIALVLRYDSRIALLAFLAVLVGLPATLYAPFAFVFRATDRMDLDAVVNIIYKALTTVVILAALYLGGGLTEVILATGVGGVGVLVVSAPIVLRLGLTVKPPTLGVLWELTRSGTPIFLYSLLIAFQPFVQVMILSALTEPEVVGWYGAFQTIFGIMLSPAMILAQASLPQLSRASLSLPDFRRVLNSTARFLLLAAAFASSSLYIFGDHIVAMIFGHGHFQQTVVILRVGALTLPLLFLGYLLGIALSAVGRNKEIALVSGATVLGGAIMNWFNIIFFQAQFGNGAIALTATAGVTEIAVLLSFAALLPRGSVGWTMPVKLLRAYAASICTILVLAVASHFELWILAPLFFLTFFLIALFTGLMSMKDLEVALIWLRKYGLAPARVNPSQTTGIRGSLAKVFNGRATSAKLNVLFIHTAGYRPLGAGPWVHSLIMRKLDRTKVAVHVALHAGSASEPGPLLANLKSADDLQIYTVDLGPEFLHAAVREAVRRPFAAIARLGRISSSFLHLMRIVYRNRIAIIHTDERPRDSFVSVLLGKITGAKVIIHLHVAYDDWMSPLFKWSLRHADLVLGVSNFVTKSLIDAGFDRQRVRTVLNSIDICEWTDRGVREKVRNELQLAPDAPVIISVCRLGQGKGPLELVQAIATVRLSHPNLRLIIVGQGSDEFVERLTRLIEELKLRQSVTLTGYRNDVPRLMSAADIYAMPSDGEPFGLVFVEAMAVGLPVVAVNNGGTPEVVVNGVTGLLSPVGDSESLAANLLTLVSNVDLRKELGEAGKKRARECFDGPRLADEVAQIYQCLVQPADWSETEFVNQ